MPKMNTWLFLQHLFCIILVFWETNFPKISGLKYFLQCLKGIQLVLGYLCSTVLQIKSVYLNIKRPKTVFSEIVLNRLHQRKLSRNWSVLSACYLSEEIPSSQMEEPALAWSIKIPCKELPVM